MKIFNDNQGMRAALSQASKALYCSNPNPRVGCVIVKNNQIIAKGHTKPVGYDHAEIVAIKDARKRGVDIKGSTIYVTLEPCNHFGRTPPCTLALVEAGISRVVIATKDPNNIVTGNGEEFLKKAGIDVITSIMEKEAREMNVGFFYRMENNLPWVRVKFAMSIDGKTALSNGNSKWITSANSRRDGHRWRAQSCAILTGIGTLLCDNPELTVRDVSTSRQPQRIILDSTLKTPQNAKILKGEKVWIATSSKNFEKETILKKKGVEIIFLPDKNGKVDLNLFMNELSRRNINELHVEAGAKLSGSLMKLNLVNELLIYISTSFLGPGIPLAELPEIDKLTDRLKFRLYEVKKIGEDLRVRLRKV